MLKRVAPFGALTLALLLWAGVTETGWIHHRAVAGPLDTFEALWGGIRHGTLLADVLATTSRVTVGVGLGTLVGVPLGLCSGTSKLRSLWMEPGLDFLRAIPPLFVFPLLLLSLGYGERARVGAVAYASGLVVSLYVAAGARRTRPERFEVLRAMGAKRGQVLRWLHLYEMLPTYLTALRHAISTGIVVAVVTEMIVGAPAGLGSRAVDAQIAYDAPSLYAVILVTGFLGYLVGAGLAWTEKRLVFWSP